MVDNKYEENKFLTYSDGNTKFYTRFKYSRNAKVFSDLNDDLTGVWYKLVGEQRTKVTENGAVPYYTGIGNTFVMSQHSPISMTSSAYFTESVKVCLTGYDIDTDISGGTTRETAGKIVIN